MIQDENGIYCFHGTQPTIDDFYEYSPTFRDERTPVVIDFGSSSCRIGWAGEREPTITFRNIVAKSRKDSEILVGNAIGNIEAFRQTLKSPFDRNVITHFETFEAVMDYGLSRIGLGNEESFIHPVCMTECPATPNTSRRNVSEVMFELYGVPSLAYGIDSLFSFQNSNQTEDALVISVGHQSIHLLPVLGNKVQYHKSRRINLGAFQLLSYMKKILQLRYPSQSTNITLSRVEDMFSLGHVSSDFFNHLKKWRDPGYYESHELKIQFPFVPVLKPPPADPETIKARRQELGRRLTEINARKREAKLKENTVLLQHLNCVKALQYQDSRFRKSLDKLRLRDETELDLLINKTAAAIQKAEEAKLRDIQRQESSEPPEEKKKRREEMDAAERVEFDVWIKDIQSKLDVLRERKEARAARRKQLAKRRTAASQERMRIINELARNNKEEDNFGQNDSDWEVYKQISRDAEESDSEEENLKAQEYEAVLREHGCNEDQVHRNSPEWHRIHLSTELIMVPEIIFQPSIIGSGQAGLAETIEFVLSKFSSEEVKRLTSNVFLTGGLAQLSGLKERLEMELRQMLPFGSSFKVTISEDSVLGAWRGASKWASNSENQKTGFMTRSEYEEQGDGFFKQHFASNIYQASPMPETTEKPDGS